MNDRRRQNTAQSLNQALKTVLSEIVNLIPFLFSHKNKVVQRWELNRQNGKVFLVAIENGEKRLCESVSVMVRSCVRNEKHGATVMQRHGLT